MPTKWWRFGQDAEKPAAGWAERVAADVAASAPEAPAEALRKSVKIPEDLLEAAAEGRLGEAAREHVDALRREEEAAPRRSESVREYLLRTRHEFERDRSALARGVVASPCACGLAIEADVHWGEALLDTRGYLAGIAVALAAALAPDDGPEEETPETVPVRRPAEPLPAVPGPLPDGVLGYNVATTRTLSGGGWLASADMMTREAAEHTISVTGGTLVEIRAVKR